MVRSTSTLRAEGWEDVLLALTTTLAAVVLWYAHGFVLDWLVIVAGIGGGVVVYLVVEFTENHPVAGVPVVVLYVLVLSIALVEETLTAGVVTAFATTTAIEVYEVYL
ncbi:MAG: hypothetical protein ABEJ42_03185 [Halobacteriaceae archaeon]